MVALAHLPKESTLTARVALMWKNANENNWQATPELAHEGAKRTTGSSLTGEQQVLGRLSLRTPLLPARGLLTWPKLGDSV